MSKNNFFAHVNTRGQDPTDRGITKGYNCEKQIGMLIPFLIMCFFFMYAI